MKKILIIEDEEKLREELQTFLNNNGYNASYLTNFDNICDNINKEEPDLILLDVNLPGNNGEYICKEYRKQSSTPIIIITSKNTEIDELISFNYGADDFITKPFNLQILLARIERLLKKNTDSVIKYEDLILDLKKSIIIKNDTVIDLSKNEFKILSYLLENRGSIVSRDDLMDYLWDNNEFVDDNTLTVNISRIKSKLAEIGYEDIIITKRGQGYIIL